MYYNSWLQTFKVYTRKTNSNFKVLFETFGVSHIFASTSRHNPISALNGKELPMFLVEREIVTELSHLATSLVLGSLFS